ncbi:class I SAM-dependent methyltransferase [Plantactinospora sonchi]|uniref:Class I SAM-dependent methyltransferase n=1 Tax=Plantactinospora sonchi TaxID=1544735 RepID=A0ABU7RR93_9ACTN
MDWVRDFYSTTGGWWGAAEARITDRDRRRVALIHAHRGNARPGRVLELGSGYGATAAATAQAGHTVTAVEVSDRADFAARFARDTAPGSLVVLKEDFYAVRLPGRFDVVCYWNGFGVGSDADQRRLLARIGDEWLTPDGVALVDVANPFVWAGWDGDEEHRLPRPELGYHHELYERTSFDPVTCTAVDTWWSATDPTQRISQRLRCYTPADLSLLLTGTGLVLDRITVGDRTSAPTASPGLPELLREQHEYLAVLRREAGRA